jgi:hypothetical protein
MPYQSSLPNGYAAIQGGRAACSEGWSSLINHSASYVTTQIIAFKYVIASEGYVQVQQIFKTGHGRFAIH